MGGRSVKESLQFLGLSDRESSIYLYVCKNPRTTAGRIIKNLRIARSKTYDGLNKLVSMGLVAKFSGGGVTKYDSSGWDVLRGLYMERVGEVAEALNYLMGGAGGISAF